MAQISASATNRLKQIKDNFNKVLNQAQEDGNHDIQKMPANNQVRSSSSKKLSNQVTKSKKKIGAPAQILEKGQSGGNLNSKDAYLADQQNSLAQMRNLISYHEALQGNLKNKSSFGYANAQSFQQQMAIREKQLAQLHNQSVHIGQKASVQQQIAQRKQHSKVISQQEQDDISIQMTLNLNNREPKNQHTAFLSELQLPGTSAASHNDQIHKMFISQSIPPSTGQSLQNDKTAGLVLIGSDRHKLIQSRPQVSADPFQADQNVSQASRQHRMQQNSSHNTGTYQQMPEPGAYEQSPQRISSQKIAESLSSQPQNSLSQKISSQSRETYSGSLHALNDQNIKLPVIVQAGQNSIQSSSKQKAQSKQNPSSRSGQRVTSALNNTGKKISAAAFNASTNNVNLKNTQLLSQVKANIYQKNVNGSGSVTQKFMNDRRLQQQYHLNERIRVSEQRRESKRPQSHQKKEVILSEQEQKTFGNRCPRGYQKIKLLGKGGIAVVWLGKKDGQFVAMKQFPKSTNGLKADPSFQVEIQIQNLIRLNSAPQERVSICQLLDTQEDKKDVWLVYELCQGRTMNDLMFDVKGEFFKGERIYMVHHSQFYHCLRQNLHLLKEFIYQMCIALNLFARIGIVHGDLKPDNIIIDYDSEKQKIRALKIIDLGSSFLLAPDGRTVRNQAEFAQSTPEYLPPEIHDFLSKRFTNQNNVKMTAFAGVSFIFDVWSLASILLETLSGFPLWLSLKSRIVQPDGSSRLNMGLFGVAGRDNSKILQKQNQLMGPGIMHLINVLKKNYGLIGSSWVGDITFIDLLDKMFHLHPGKRISPEEILEHDFMATHLGAYDQLIASCHNHQSQSLLEEEGQQVEENPLADQPETDDQPQTNNEHFQQ